MTVLGKQEPRIFTPPLRELTPETSLGFDVIDFAYNVLGATLLPWQEWLLIHALEIIGDLDGDWHFRFRTVVIEIARQNGKTELSKILCLWFMYVFGVPLVLGTAQTLALAEEIWKDVVEEIEANDELAAEIQHIVRSNGKESIELLGGREYKIAPLSRKGGRGYSGDLILLDELREHTTWEAWAAITKTTLARKNALVWCMSNAGDAASIVLRHLRLQAHKLLGDPDGICKQLEKLGDPDEDVVFDETLGIFEWSAPPECAKDDEEAWAYANPSMNYGEVNPDLQLITSRAIRSAMIQDPEDKFRTECLCQWITTAAASPFPGDSWENGKDRDSHRAPDSRLCYGIDVSSDHRHIAVAICGKRADQDWHIEPIGYFTKQTAALNFLRERVVKDGGHLSIACQGKGANVSLLIDTLEEIQGLELIRVEGSDLSAYHGRFYEGVAACETGSEHDAAKIYHRPAPILDIAANTAVTKPMGDGAWVFNRDKSPEDISALVACVMAHGLATAAPKAKRISAYADGHELIFL